MIFGFVCSAEARIILDFPHHKILHDGFNVLYDPPAANIFANVHNMAGSCKPEAGSLQPV